jgi:hypothetical protein
MSSRSCGGAPIGMTMMLVTAGVRSAALKAPNGEAILGVSVQIRKMPIFRAIPGVD